METIGIVAGNGELPLIAARNAQDEGFNVSVCAIKGETDPKIEEIVKKVHWIKLGELKKLAAFLLADGAKQVCFEGKITKTSIFSGHLKPDLDMVVLFAKLKNKKDDTILGALCDYLESKGLYMIDSTRFLKDVLPQPGILTKKKPSQAQKEDIEFGWALAKESGRLDFGQSVVVKDKAVLAVEAIEGTDEAIKRGGALGRGDVVVVKVAKPEQDMRFDVPTVGPRTIETMIQAGAKVLAFEAGKTIMVDKDAVIEMANKQRLIIQSI
jgi:UDP-2,3-diacylglucosamine hydrolase